MIRALFFGPVADRVGAREIDLEFRAGMTLQEVFDACLRSHPEALALVSFVALNGVQARDMSVSLADGSEIAFMAKFSGG